MLTGKVKPSRRLPITFPADLSQMPRPVLPGLGTPYNTPITIRYDEGAEVGYRWFAKKNEKPLFAFGHGLSGAVGSPAPGVGRPQPSDTADGAPRRS